MKTWIKDKFGNRAAVEYYGSEEAAWAALRTLVDCTECVNCERCYGCYRCKRCVDCQLMEASWDCKNCEGGLLCERCDNCHCCNYCVRCRNLENVEWFEGDPARLRHCRVPHAQVVARRTRMDIHSDRQPPAGL